ncbi:MAG: YybH family protein [Gemmatimonadales bacterium]
MGRMVLGLVVIAAAACGQARPISEADKAAIRAASDSFGVLARDQRDSAIALLYTENAVLMAPNLGVVEGRAAIRAFFGMLPAMSLFRLTPVDIDGRGDLAYVRGTYTLTMSGPGGEPLVDRGKYVEIRRRAGGREWPIAIDIFNSDLPGGAIPTPPTPGRRQ